MFNEIVCSVKSLKFNKIVRLVKSNTSFKISFYKNLKFSKNRSFFQVCSEIVHLLIDGWSKKWENFNLSLFVVHLKNDCLYFFSEQFRLFVNCLQNILFVLKNCARSQIPIYILSLHIFQLMIIFMLKEDWITIVKCEILTHIHIKLCKILNLEHILYIYVLFQMKIGSDPWNILSWKI